MDANTVYEMVMRAITEDEASEEYAKIQDEFSKDSECDRLYGEIYEAKQYISQQLTFSYFRYNNQCVWKGNHCVRPWHFLSAG